MINNNWTAFLVSLSYGELRHRQLITQAQIKIAYEMAQQPSRRQTGLKALNELNDMYDSLTEAIAIRYADDPKVP